MNDTIKGSCHCGSIHYELSNKPKSVVNCHCDECKKRNGSAYSTYLAVSENDYHISKGEDALKQYSLEREGIKYFCAECGSPLYNKNYRYPGLYMVFYGSLSQATDIQPSINIYCESKHDWVDSIDRMTCFNGPIQR